MEKKYKEDIVYARPENIGGLVTCAWFLMTAVLWPGRVFSNKEKARSCSRIRGLIRMNVDPYRSYLEFCQRVLLTAELPVSAFRAVSNVMPGGWLISGFPLTARPFEWLTEKRKSNALYHDAIRTLPEAIVEMLEAPGSKQFNYWKHWFTERKAFDEWLLFCNCTAHILYNHQTSLP